MRFKRQAKLELGLGPIAIAPLIDVIFLILIFFMLSSFTPESGISVKLPKAITSDIIKEENLIITITDEDIIYLNNKITNIKDLQQILVKNKTRPILIKTNRRASVGRIVDVWNLCRNLGIQRINIATNQEN